MGALILGLVAGIASPIQASINTEARKFFRSPFVTAIVNFAVAWLALAAFIVATEHRFFIPLADVAENPPWIWLGGIFGIMIVTLNILCVPKLGAANNVMILNFGQIVTGLVVDQFALLGAECVPMTLLRFAGAVIVFIGLVLVTKEKAAPGTENNRSLPVLYVILSFICGVACSAQIAVNGTLRMVVRSVSKATLISMSVAFIATAVLICATALIKGRGGLFDSEDEIQRIPFKPWLVSGGLFALIVVSCNAAVAPVLGTGLSTITNLVGMMAGGLVIDAAGFLGIEKKPVTLRKIAGMLIMLAGTALISFL